MSTLSDKTDRPPLRLTSEIYERLSQLVEVAADRQPEVAAYLGEEIERAEIVPDDALEPDVVTMGSHVVFRDPAINEEWSATLVYPVDESLDNGRISVLTPIGAALIGVAAGQSITYYTRSGEPRTLKVLRVGRDGRARARDVPS